MRVEAKENLEKPREERYEFEESPQRPQPVRLTCTSGRIEGADDPRRVCGELCPVEAPPVPSLVHAACRSQPAV